MMGNSDYKYEMGFLGIKQTVREMGQYLFADAITNNFGRFRMRNNHKYGAVHFGNES
jgi:hypothetical protein